MERDARQDLDRWIHSEDRLPLVVRGARQVGKTWLVREFANRAGRRLVEVNFERDPADASLFADPDPRVAVRRLEARSGVRIDARDTVLFLDEVQAAPRVFAGLRWFAEEMPELPVLAAGSLLDFALEEPAFRMPVGRVGYLHLEPMNFEEFLAATGKAALREYVEDLAPGEDIPEALHLKLMSALREYLLVGGMPFAVGVWAGNGSILDCAEVHHRLLSTFRDDFRKYSGRVPPERLTRVFDAVPRFLGRKFVYSRVAGDDRSRQIRAALDLLTQARVATRVACTDGTGVPLGAEVRDRVFKVIFLDTGLASASLGLSWEDVDSLDQLALVNRGGIAEQAVGQALRGDGPRYRETALHYWASERSGRAAEVDYLVQHGTSVVPVEVKAGKAGTLKSLHLFMALRGLPLAVRFNTDPPSLTPVEVNTTTGQTASYRLLSLPLYLAGQFQRLVAAAKVA